ncbi:hypothetical protein VKT23_013916 [Stygiomarasmius scandens]|uniref:FHA domain-containing protein n=1 Tax=Marasmiellus scandens TaxID=2682957 RepID=A0ABR1J1Q9_9AGAR
MEHMKHNNPANTITVTLALGIGTEVLTFGRDKESGIRICYPDIDQLHCKVTFDEKKLDLLQSLSYHNSAYQQHRETVQDPYPPKELRAQLCAPPTDPTLDDQFGSVRFSSASASPSPIQKSIFPQPDLEDEAIVLVEGNEWSGKIRALSFSNTSSYLSRTADLRHQANPPIRMDINELLCQRSFLSYKHNNRLDHRKFQHVLLVRVFTRLF